MAVCDWCQREMLTASTCTVATFHRGIVGYPLPRNGRYRCHDCHVAPGGLHHPGCDMARCPACAGQLLSCGCRFDEDGACDDDEFGES